MFSEKNCCRNEFRSFAGVRFGRFQAGIRLCGATVSTKKAHDKGLPCAFLFRELPYKVVRPFIFSSTMASMTATAVILTMSRTELSKSVK